MWDLMERAFGLQLRAGELAFSHMAWRGLVVFVFAVVLARVADRRFLGHNAGYDIMLGVILGSVLSRGINGDAAFFPTLGVSALLILLHHLLCTAAFRWHGFSRLVKGRPRVLIADGQANHAELRRCKITNGEIDENLRLSGKLTKVSEVKEARLEQNGRISVIPRDDRGV
jgi:uncharacterized membrane protein YcaP (DUF421 family)